MRLKTKKRRIASLCTEGCVSSEWDDTSSVIVMRSYSTLAQTTLIILAAAAAIWLPSPCYCDQESAVTSAITASPLEMETSDDSISKRDQIEGWSDWGQWNICSRSCDGGISYRLRKCMSKTGCIGDSIKYHICNMQSCPEPNDFRATQCSAYNNIAYRDLMYTWLPFYDPADPCSLTCKAKDFSFVAKLAPRVQDGTRCREGALDMCVAGKCMSVGCDLRVGSKKKIDECGVCGGDGSGCRRPAFIWTESEFSPCSVTCGGGFQVSHPTCRKKDTEKEVDERLCNLSIRPRPKVKSCNTHKCPVVWVTEEWTPCSASCGHGTQTRSVFCAQGGPNGTRIHVSSSFCPRHKPVIERSCTVHECPRWFEGPWSACSATCGQGIETRAVVCRDTRGQYSEDCDSTSMPLPRRYCNSGVVCPTGEGFNASSVPSPGAKGSQEDSPPYISLSPPTEAATESATEAFPTEPSLPSFFVSPWGPCSASCGDGVRRRIVQCQIFLEFSRTVARLPDRECPGIRPVDVERCSSSCSNPLLRIKPTPAFFRGEHTREARYSWKIQGFTPCSVSCLGGIKETIISCIRDVDQVEMAPYLCDSAKKPNSTTETCNDHPCRPKWNITEFGACTKSCGGGIRTREVKCLHEIVRGADILTVPNKLCPQPIPKTEEYCNVIECPPRWRSEIWSKCSQTCGGGIQTRKIRCQKMLAFGEIVEQSPSKCHKSRPKASKKCNRKPCPLPKRTTTPRPTTTTTIITTTTELTTRSSPPPRPSERRRTTPIPLRPSVATTTRASVGTISPSVSETYVQKLPNRRVTLKATGRAVLFKGSTVKFHCPNNKPNQTRVLWYKGRLRLHSDRRRTISLRGALRIRKINFSDGGTYSCLVGPFKSEITISIKPLPQGYANSQDGDDFAESHGEEDLSDPGKDENDGYSYNFAGGKEANQVSKFPPDLKPSSSTLSEKTNFYSDVKHYLPYKERNQEIVETTSSPVLLHEDIYIMNKVTSDVPRTVSERTPDKSESIPSSSIVSDQESSLSGTMPSQRYHNRPQTTNASNADGRPLIDASALPQVRHFLVNMRHFKHRQPTLQKPSATEENPLIVRGATDSIEFDWMVTSWSECSHSCGGNGIQVRSIECQVRLHNVTRVVANSLCVDGGLEEPITLRRCGSDECPQWHMGEWSECSENNCLSWNTAYQKREVNCRLDNFTVVRPSMCDERTRPRRKRECFNGQCKGMWRVGDWSPCTTTCGDAGFRSRILQCVWYGSRMPAGNACRDLPRPAVMVKCTGPPCSDSNDCVDASSYCDVVKDTKLCRMSQFRLQCCASCRTT